MHNPLRERVGMRNGLLSKQIKRYSALNHRQKKRQRQTQKDNLLIALDSNPQSVRSLRLLFASIILDSVPVGNRSPSKMRLSKTDRIFAHRPKTAFSNDFDKSIRFDPPFPHSKSPPGASSAGGLDCCFYFSAGTRRKVASLNGVRLTGISFASTNSPAGSSSRLHGI